MYKRQPYRHVDRLTRVYEYMGPAWYQRDIEFPAEWKGKCIFLYFERTHWLSSVWVDTKEVSRLDYISVPHNHDLTDFVTPGKTHRITVCIDNRFQYNTHKWNHAHTEFTQINWNGILGEMKLVAVDPVYIDDMQLYPDVAKKSVEVRLKIDNRTKKPFGLIRVLVDACYLVCGYFFGGVIGIGTVVCVIAIGPMMQFVMKHIIKQKD